MHTLTEEQKQILLSTPLFNGIAAEEADALLDCLDPMLCRIPRDGAVLSAGDTPRFVGVVLEGDLHIVHDDYWGNRAILSTASAGDVFGEAFSLAPAQPLPVSVVAKRESRVLLFDSGRVLRLCPRACTGHTALLRNMILVLAGNNMALTDKIRHITKKTTREKVMSYLSEIAAKAGKNSFDIPFNRQEMADYLAVERSALSATLCKLRDEGLIDFRKNHFSLYC